MLAPLILDLCGHTGAWSDDYAKAGYDVRIVTLPDDDVRTYKTPPNVHGILAAPPCTMFSLARTTAATPRDFKSALEVVDGCLRIIREARLGGSLQWWALENPVGYLRQFLGVPGFTFNPYDFGDPWTKPTDLWGYFDPPKFKFCRPEFNLDQAAVKLRDRGESLTIGQRQVKLSTSDVLAVTPPGFAMAFFKANS